MKKHLLISAGVLSALLLLYFLLKERPRYFTLEIPMPQNFIRYEGEFATKEEFSTYISNDGFDQHRHYFVYRMYIPVHLGEEGFETKDDVENYYDEWLKKLGWKEERTVKCDSYRMEFISEGSYRAYVYPTQYYHQPIACLTTWFEYGDEELLTVLIKTINPSREVLWESD